MAQIHNETEEQKIYDELKILKEAKKDWMDSIKWLLEHHKTSETLDQIKLDIKALNEKKKVLMKNLKEEFSKEYGSLDWIKNQIKWKEERIAQIHIQNFKKEKETIIYDVDKKWNNQRVYIDSLKPNMIKEKC